MDDGLDYLKDAVADVLLAAIVWVHPNKIAAVIEIDHWVVEDVLAELRLEGRAEKRIIVGQPQWRSRRSFW